ncbi:MAG TPA: GDP-mannose 4,6-dehydratase [bacterium]
MPKKAFLTGINGQDGSYLTELLLEKGYEVHGIFRRSSVPNMQRLEHLLNKPDVNLKVHFGDLNDFGNLIQLLSDIQPDEVYNLGAQSEVGVSFENPSSTAQSTALGALHLLEAIRQTGIRTRFYQASSSEMFGLVQEVPQKETTPFHPRSPYGVSKVFAYWMTVNYREAYKMFNTNGILFNHESPRRGEAFVTRKITLALARIKAGLQDKLFLGNLNARRDWGYAKDYVEAMWLMLQQEKPEDFVISTGETHSIKEFLEESFGYAGLDYQKYVQIDPKLIRPAEVDLLLGDSSKAAKVLEWKPRVDFKGLVHLMVDADFKLLGLKPPSKK